MAEVLFKVSATMLVVRAILKLKRVHSNIRNNLSETSGIISDVLIIIVNRARVRLLVGIRCDRIATAAFQRRWFDVPDRHF